MKILYGEPSKHLADRTLKATKAKEHEFLHVITGPECIDAIDAFAPDLIIIDIMMPVMHGIEILHKIRAEGNTTPVIVTSFQTLVQNYNAAIEAGANYFLAKPYSHETLFTLVAASQNGTLHPEKLPEPNGHAFTKSTCYTPHLQVDNCYIKFWGTRGSNPVAGNEYVRYGGNTCCLEIRYNDTVVIIDAGTGIRPLGEKLGNEPERDYNLFIGHTHWDHITGFPFFTPLYHKKGKVTIWSPIGFEKSTKELFTDMLAYAYFPVRLEEMDSKIEFNELRDTQPVTINEITIDTFHTNHPGPTLGFKIKSPNKTIGYITDNETLMGYVGHPNEIHAEHELLEPHLGLIEFLKDCDTVIHEAQYLPQEYPKKIGWGHSSVSNATVLIREIGCDHWIVTHHEPTHTDEKIELKAQLHKDILKECNVDTTVEMAYDGYIIPL